jgi:ABC-type branched-subunit amino acid transport system ATPase component
MSAAPDHDTALLDVEGVCFSYGRLPVLFDVSVRVPGGGRVALLGTNGAGKSTLLQVVSGVGRPTSGRVRYQGDDITHLSAQERVRRGIVQVAGGKATFPSLTVLENLRLGAYQFLRRKAVVEERLEDAFTRFPRLRERMRQQAGVLSGGEQQTLAIARALVTGPRLLIIDELSLGLAPLVVAELLEALEHLCAAGISTLVVEQSLNVAMAIADTAYFMEKGEVRYTGPIAELHERGDLARSVFLGTEPRKAG